MPLYTKLWGSYILQHFDFEESYDPIPLFLSVLSLLIMGTGKDWKWQHATWQHSKSIKSQWFRVQLFHFEKKIALQHNEILLICFSRAHAKKGCLLRFFSN